MIKCLNSYYLLLEHKDNFFVTYVIWIFLVVLFMGTNYYNPMAYLS